MVASLIKIGLVGAFSVLPMQTITDDNIPEECIKFYSDATYTRVNEDYRTCTYDIFYSNDGQDNRPICTIYNGYYKYMKLGCDMYIDIKDYTGYIYPVTFSVRYYNRNYENGSYTYVQTSSSSWEFLGDRVTPFYMTYYSQDYDALEIYCTDEDGVIDDLHFTMRLKSYLGPTTTNYSYGYAQGIDETYDSAYDNGYDAGYDAGYDLGYNSGVMQDKNSYNWLIGVFDTISHIMDIELLPKMKLSYLIGIPFIITLVTFIIGWFR